MIIILGAVGGGVYGALLARARKGTRLDMAQYGAGFAIAFGLVGLFVSILIDRLV